jgi:RNA recognition motif-containing protein
MSRATARGTTKLYVANLPHAPNALALRAHFSACGFVSDIEIVSDRNGGRGRGSALVRMGSAASAERALSELNGSTFGGQLLLVEAAPDTGEDRSSSGNRREKQTEEDRAGVRITVQYREPANMAYELDCSGVTLVIRVCFPSATGESRIVVQTSREAGAPNVAATAGSRIDAFREVVRICRDGVAVADFARVDWDAVEHAMLQVRAI